MILYQNTAEEQIYDQYIQQLKSEIHPVKFKKLHISEYVDNQLKHLIIEQKFNFDKISELLSLMFPEYEEKLTSRLCAERWYQIHYNRKYCINERQNNKYDKKIQSIMAFEDPKKLFTARQLIQELEVEQKRRQLNKKPNEIQINKKEYNGFNIIKDSIKNKDKQELKKLEVKFLVALQKAKQIDDQMCEKPFLYRPKFIIDNPYELQKQDLTKQKATQILNQNLKINNYVVSQFSKPQVIEIVEFKSKFAVDKEQKNNKRNPFGYIEDNWSDYESDSQTES